MSAKHPKREEILDLWAAGMTEALASAIPGLQAGDSEHCNV